MQELGRSAWKQPTILRIEGIGFAIESHSVWSGLSATVVEADCETASTITDSVDCSRLVVLLEQQGGRVEIGAHRSRRPEPTHDTVHQMAFGPPGAPQWGFFNKAERFRWIVLQFDLPLLAETMCEELVGAPEFRPRHMFHDPRLLQLARQFEAQAGRRDPPSSLHADTLSVALALNLARLEGVRSTTGRPSPHLTPRQSRQATDYMRIHLSENIRLKDLADLVRLSPAHFCRAFKASTGLPPHRWQLRERIRKAQHDMRTGAASLTEIALASGFSDQAHFTNVFRRTVGVSPNVWRRLHQG